MEDLKEHTSDLESGTAPGEPASAILLKAKGALKTLREIMIGLTVHEMSAFFLLSSRHSGAGVRK